MTAEDIDELIDDVGVEHFVASLARKGFVTQALVSEPTAPADALSTARVAMLDARGFPMANHVVHVETLRVPAIVTIDGARFFVGAAPSKEVLALNATGELHIKLIKGARVAVTVEGCFTREFTVPDSDFDVLDLPSDQDGFTAPKVPVTQPIRMS